MKERKRTNSPNKLISHNILFPSFFLRDTMYDMSWTGQCPLHSTFQLRSGDTDADAPPPGALSRDLSD
jgi:hypothetical protein